MSVFVLDKKVNMSSSNKQSQLISTDDECPIGSGGNDMGSAVGGAATCCLLGAAA